MISININVATREKSELVQCNSTSLAEELCIIVCKRLHISQIATTLFALRLIDSNLYLAPNASVEQYNNLTLRIRYRVPNLTRLKNLDVQAHNYYFHQVKNDVMDNKIPEIVYAKHRDELLGLGITDMYRLMVEEKKNREEVEKDYRKYIPREVIKKHKMFTKKPIHNTLMQFSKSAAAADPGFIKEQYLKKFNTMAPNYLSEEYNVLFDSNASNDAVILHVMPFHIEEPGLRIYYKIKKQWEHLCAIDEICSMSSRSDGTVEINRKNGIPAYLKFSEVQQMLSFISVCDGYYRLMVKWTFNLCNEVTSPGLQRLHNLKCHGPVGGEFSYHKLEEKRANKSGCFIMRQCEKKFDTYYIDVCSKNSTKPETYKIENIANSYILYDKDKTQYSTLPKLIADHNNAEENIYLQECLPPSEYDKSQVLLCEDVGHGPANRIGQVNLDDLLANIRGPRCIHTRDILVFKSPWCYTETDVDDVFEKHFCDVPLCDIVNDPIFTIENENYYTHYISLDKSTSNLIFGIKLWDPDSIIYAYGKLTFSVLGTPAKGEDFIRWGMGIEIIISSAGIGLTIGTHKMLLEPQPLLLTSMKYRYFNLLWTDDTITLRLPQEENKVLYVASITNKGVLATENDFSFYTFHGSNILWTFSENQSCEIHTTFETDYIMKWKLPKTNYRFEKAFHVRSYHSISIALLSTPIEYTFKILILIGLKDNITSIIFDDSHSPVITLKTVVKPNILDYWKWNEFLFSIEFDIFTLFWMHETGFVPVLSISDPHFKTIRWFSIGSIKSISHWSLNCKPEPIKPVYPPYCASFFVKFDYAGSQWVTSEGFPCIPWIDTKNVNMFLKTMISNNNAGLVYLKNHCRNRLKGINGPSCVAVTPLGFKKSICNVQMCSGLGCTSAGTGVDYVEIVNYTRQNYICTAWSSLDGDKLAKFPKNAFEYDKDITQAKNYCRNPTRNIAGPWCFTTNKSVPVDLCNIAQCDEEIESTIIFVSAVEEKNILLVFPEWKYFGLNIAFKVWDPERIDGLVIKIFSSSRKEYQSISIDKERRKIILHYRDTTTNISVVLAEKILPELIPVGKWGKYWLRLMKGSIMLGYKDLKHPIFKWSGTNEVINFEPLYIAFLPNNDYPIGINFPDRECLIEISTARRSSRMMSLGLWSMQKKLMYNNLRLSLRGDGKAIVSLHILPNADEYYSITIDNKNNTINFVKNAKSRIEVLASVTQKYTIFSKDTWTEFLITFNNFNLKVLRNGISLMAYKSENLLLFYWFSLFVENGWVMWAANCDPFEPNESPIDGGWTKWSEWRCNVLCGGGTGDRTRECIQPKSNFLGKSCSGSFLQVGRCNDFECGELPPEIIHKIKVSLQTYHSSVEVMEGGVVRFDHSVQLAYFIHENSPFSNILWTFDGRLLNIIHYTNWTSFQNQGLFIEKVTSANSGIYALIVEMLYKKKMIVSMVSVAVRSKTQDIVVPRGTEIKIPCKATPLGMVYEELSQIWFLNNVQYKNYGITLLPLTELEVINVNVSHSGTWKCRIVSDFNFVWTTNIVRVHVKTPGLLSYLLDDPILGEFFKIFGTGYNVLIFLIIILSLFILILCIGTFFCMTISFGDDSPAVNKKPKIRDDLQFDEHHSDPTEASDQGPAENVKHENPQLFKFTTFLNVHNRKSKKTTGINVSTDQISPHMDSDYSKNVNSKLNK